MKSLVFNTAIFEQMTAKHCPNFLEIPMTWNHLARTLKLTRIQNVRVIMNYQTGSTSGSGSCVSGFGLIQKWKLRTRFQLWAISTFGPVSLKDEIRNHFLDIQIKELGPVCQFRAFYIDHWPRLPAQNGSTLN